MEQKSIGKEGQSLKKIDIHVHSLLKKGIERPRAGGTFATPQELCAMYDQLGIEKGVLLPVVSPECQHVCLTNEEACAIVAGYPDRFAWFCNIDPRQGENSPDSDLSPFIAYYKSQGARGVGEVTANLYFDDPLVLNLFYHCERCAMPLTFHIGNKGGDYGLIDEIGLPRLEKVLGLYPDLRFLGHSQKFWAEIGPDVTAESRKGYPTGRVLPGGRLVALMRRYPNLCGDLSAGSGSNAVMRDPEFGWAFIEEFQDRLYFGTDICDPRNITNPMLKLSAWLDQAAENGRISRRAYERVCRNNALSLLERP